MFWKNKKVFITGYTGFKGTWLCLMLNQLGAKIYGFCRTQDAHPQFYHLTHLSSVMTKEIYGDIRDYDQVAKSIHAIAPDIIFHLAAQPLVIQSYKSPLETFETNIQGCLNVLEAVRMMKKPCIIVNVTTDKVYKNLQLSDYAYQEEDALGGNDPYSASKAAVELISHSYQHSFFKNSSIRLATARAGNVIGGGDFAPNRLIPDTISNLIAHQPILIRHPNYIRPWQHVLDALNGYRTLAEKLHANEKFIGAYNFGPDALSACSVQDVVEKVIRIWGSGTWQELPDNTHEEAYLILNSEKAIQALQWKPKYNIDQAIEKTTLWYKAWHEKQDMQAYSLSEIDQYLR